MFRAVPLPIIRSLFTVHPALVYVIQVRRQPFEQDQDGTPIIRRLFTVHSALVYVIQVRRQPFQQGQDGTQVHPGPARKAVFEPVWHIPVPGVQWINFWWWAEQLPETCRFSSRSKYGKLVLLVGFIIMKFVTMHGHMNVKYDLHFRLPLI